LVAIFASTDCSYTTDFFDQTGEHDDKM